ncbi:GDP-mannose 4,6-dehydratase [Ferruginibacter sp. SUN002]|uniref:GDP-mannose 4,6-dehydratase n=1 Tax=Ferruginibacter sp. SUN002 TaxID=2937789 RepID=UPI003D3604C9
MTSIIFGANGQDGYYLSQLLQQEGHIVIGVSRNGGFLKTNIADYAQVSELIQQYKPDYIFHLAANSTTRHDALFENHATISTGTINILEAAKAFSPSTKIFISGSGLQFKNNDRPIKETDEFEARDPYSVSRILSVYAARYYRKLGLNVYVGYFFNHDSPRRSERHMAMKIAAFAKRAVEGDKLPIGDIAAIKEWTYAGDIVKGILTLVQQEHVFEANIASGKGYSIENWLTACFSIANKNWKDFVVVNPDFIPDYKQLVADATLIHSLGWKPAVSFEELAKMMMMDV